MHLQLRLPHHHSPRSSTEQSIAGRTLAAKAWLNQFELDRELTGGVDIHTSAELQARARQLQSEHVKRHLVAAIDGALEKAEHPPQWRSTRLPVQASEVKHARAALAALQQALASPEPSVRGIAQASCLLNDFESPLYHHRDGLTVAELANLATAACTRPSQQLSQLL